MQIYIAKNRQRSGPYELPQVQNDLNSGRIAPTDLAWYDGAPGWIPVSQVPGISSSRTPSFSASGFSPAFSSAETFSPQVRAGQYAGFWLRVAAHLIDGFICYAAFFIISLILGLLIGVIYGLTAAASKSRGDQETLMGIIYAVVYVAAIIIVWLYYAVMESSSKQATVGKMACSIRVTDLAGNRISFGRATGRHFGKFVSFLTICVGFMMCGWTQRKQCLHDMMASCLVSKK